MLYQFPNIHERSIKADYPFGIFNIELTNKCPMRCVMCPRTKYMTREKGFMAFDLYQRAIDELVSVNPDYMGIHPVWLHHFGESLLHKEFGKFIRYGAAKQVCVCLSINPIMLKDYISREMIESSPYMLYISLDGHDDASFHKIRGIKNAYQLSHDNLMRFLELKKKANSPIRIVLSMIDFPLNQNSTEKMRLYWESVEGVDQVLMKAFSTWDGAAAEVNALADASEEESAKAVDWVTCNFPWERMSILWDGDVVPCCSDYNKKLVLGSLQTQTLSEVWNGKPMQALREEFISNQVTNPLCRNCGKLRMSRDALRW